jgi:hypothetical protein
VFFGNGCCSECHAAQTSFLDNNMQNLKLERSTRSARNDLVTLPDGPIKTFTLHGIKDSPPYA